MNILPLLFFWKYTLNQDFLDAIKEDCKVLLGRALLDKTVNVFGIDGMGQYGTHHQGLQYTIDAISIDVEANDDMTDVRAVAHIALDGYNAMVYGDVATDRNLEISINELFKAYAIDTNCWRWSDQESQGMISFTIKIDVVKLLSW